MLLPLCWSTKFKVVCCTAWILATDEEARCDEDEDGDKDEESLLRRDFLMRRDEARRAILSAMQIFESGPRRWALEPKKALILGSVTLNDPDHLVVRPEGVRGRTTSMQESCHGCQIGWPTLSLRL